jgi:hypothetical protein
VKRTSFACRSALLASVLSLGGCFAYIPADIDAVPDGQNVRVYLTRQGMVSLPELPDLNEPYLRGMLSRRADDGFYLRVPVATRQEGFHQSEIGQDVWIPAGEIVQFERREFNRTGTGFLIAGTAGLAGAVVFLIIKDHLNSNPGEGCTVNCEEFRVPLLSIPVR